MSTRHFFHDPEALVLDCLESLTTTNKFLGFDRTNKSIFYTGHDSSKNVTLISGGGAGHEPAHAGFVGDGLFTAAVSGSIFASPNASQILNTISRVSGAAGTILKIKIYTGDVFHFHLAAEKARAKYGLKVEIIVVGDDVSVGRQKSGKTELSSNSVTTLMGLSNIIEESMDGTSGALYSIFFNAPASALRSLPSTSENLDGTSWGSVLSSALIKLKAATPARQGDRTLMDALEPFIISFAKGGAAKTALEQARKGVEATKGMQAAFGRAVYVEESTWSHVPDPGAEGILCILEGLVGTP